jgi:L-rhamnonate dehydratase
MKITEVHAVYPNYRHVVPSWRTHFWQIVVRIVTDVGAVGFGYGGGGVAGVEIVNRHFRELLLEREINSPADIADIWDHLYEQSLPYGRKGLAMMSLSGVDLALYDLLAKAESQPVYQLLGGARKPRVLAYATGPDSEAYRDLGFRAHKFPHRWEGEGDYDTAAMAAANARRLYGPDARIMVDCYMSWDAEVTTRMADILREHNLYWYEDVLTPDNLAVQADLGAVAAPTLIAGGEHEFTHFGFADIARAEALGLWQPDITWCGGITAGLRIIDLARDVGIPVSPHRGAEVWGLHLIVASDWANFAEYHSDHIRSPRDALWLDEPEPQDGFIVPSDQPGFGVKLNEEML